MSGAPRELSACDRPCKPILDSSRPRLVAQVAVTNKTYTWTFRDPKLITKDEFPEVLGSKGDPGASEHKQRKVVKGLTGLTGRKGVKG